MNFANEFVFEAIYFQISIILWNLFAETGTIIMYLESMTREAAICEHLSNLNQYNQGEYI